MNPIGQPVVRPSKSPDRISTVSLSFLAVVTADCPGESKYLTDCIHLGLLKWFGFGEFFHGSLSPATSATEASQ